MKQNSLTIFTSDDAEVPKPDIRGRKDTTFPPKPKEAPTGRLYHFGALKDTA